MTTVRTTNLWPALPVKKAEIIRQQQIAQNKTDREYLSKYLYDKGEDFLDIASNAEITTAFG